MEAAVKSIEQKEDEKEEVKGRREKASASFE